VAGIKFSFPHQVHSAWLCVCLCGCVGWAKERRLLSGWRAQCAREGAIARATKRVGRAFSCNQVAVRSVRVWWRSKCSWSPEKMITHTYAKLGQRFMMCVGWAILRWRCKDADWHFCTRNYSVTQRTQLTRAKECKCKLYSVQCTPLHD